MITDPRIGTELGGYRIESVLGHGGMGVVYVARHLRLDRTVALKVVSAELAGDTRFRDRFVRESRLAASLEHPNIVPIHDAGEADGVLYLAMRLVHGADLKSLIQEQERLDPARTVRILEQVGGALDAAHQARLVHRDVKPGNVLVSSPGTPGEHAYLSDFGLTKRMTSDSGLTGTGQFVGTLDYAAPEQFEGKALDARTDVYSLGCVLYECLAGDIPFRRDNQAGLVYAHLMAPPPKVTEKRPDLPPAIDHVVTRAMAKAPGDRYPSAWELVAAVRTALGPLTAPAPGRLSPPPPLRRRSLLVGAGALAVVLALVAALLVARRGTPTTSPSPATSPSGPVLAEGDRVVRISQATSNVALARLEPIRVGRDPSAVTIAEGSVWVTNAGDGTVSRIDPVSSEARTIEVGRQPSAATFGEGALWVLNRVSSSVSRIDPGSNRVVATIDVTGHSFPSSIAITEGAVWVFSDSGFDPGREPAIISRIDPTTNRVVATVEGEGLDFQGGVIAAHEGALWIATYRGNVIRVDAASNQTRQISNVGSVLRGLIGADRSLWVATRDGQVLRVDPDRGEVEGTASGGGAPSGTLPHNQPVIGMGFGNGIVWITGRRTGTIDRIVTNSTTALDPIPVGQTPTGVASGYGSVWVTVDSSA